MAWGKGGSTNVVQVTTRSRRAASVPAVDVSSSYQPTVGRRTASTVNYAKEDADNISSSSRGKDARLLNDITTRLANAEFTQPVTVRRRNRSLTRRAPSLPGSRRGSVSSTASYSVPRKPASLADEDFEIVFPYELRPGRRAPCERRAYNRDVFQRSSSLPPAQPPPRRDYYGAPPSKGSNRDIIDLGSPLFRVVSDSGSKASNVTSAPAPPTNNNNNQGYNDSYYYSSPWAPRPPPVTQARRRYSFAFERPEDVIYTPYRVLLQQQQRVQPPPYPTYQRVATVPLTHVRPYTSIPRRSTYTYRTENDYRPSPVVVRGFRATSEPRPPLMTPSSSLAVKQARASLGRIERELGMNSSSGYLDDAPYLDEPIITTTTTRVPLRSSSVSRTGFIRGTAPSSGSSYSSYSSRPPPGPSPSRRHEIEARLETMVTPDFDPPASYSSLRSRTTEARDKLGQHGRMLDRYLPVPAGVPNEVQYEVDYRFNELANRMPQLKPRERTEATRATSLPPYRPANAQGKGSVNTYNDALRRAPFVPRVSDTRKRAREVLCRTKRDPHYFDY